MKRKRSRINQGKRICIYYKRRKSGQRNAFFIYKKSGSVAGKKEEKRKIREKEGKRRIR